MTADALTLPLPEDGNRRREVMLITLIGIVHGMSHFFHLMLPPLFPWLMQELHLGFAEIGATMSVFFIVSGIGQSVAGFAVDRWGAARVLAFGLSCMFLGAVVLALGSGYGMLFVAAALAGLGNSIFHPADFTALNRHISKERLGHAFSVHGLSGSLGWAAGPLLMTGVATWGGWRLAAATAAGIALIGLLCLWLGRGLLRDTVAPAAPAKAGEEGAPAHSSFAFLSVPAVWLCFAFFFLTTNTVGVFQNFGPPLMENLYGLSFGVATLSLTTFLLGSAGGMITGGFMVSRGGDHERRIAIVLLCAAGMAVLLATGWLPSWLVLPWLAVMGFCNGIAGPSRDMLVRQVAAKRFGQSAFGRIYGFVYSGLDTGLALAPVGFGLLMDRHQYSAVLFGLAVLQTLAVWAAVQAGRKH